MRVVYWILNALWLVLLLPAASAFFEEYGWHAWLWGVPGLIYNLALRTFGAIWFPWIAGMMVGIAFGVLGHRIFNWMVAGRKTKSKELINLAITAHNVSNGIRHTIDGLSGPKNLKENGIAPKLQGRLEGLFSDLERFNIPAPDLNDLPPMEALLLARNYFDYIGNFLARGDENLCRERANDWVSSRNPN